MTKRIPAFLIFSCAAIFFSCSSFNEFVKSNFRKPSVNFAGAKIDHLSFEKIGLLFDVKITNPNPIGVKLTGFDFDFLLNDHSFVRGDNNAGVEIPANGQHIVPVLVSMKFDEVYQAFTILRNQDSTRYQLNAGFSFDLPILGMQRVPISKNGSVPLIKIPKIGVESLKLNKLTLSGADLTLRIKLSNANAIAFLLNGINYRFDVNRQQWLSGSENKSQSVPAKGEAILNLPISLNFFQIGQSVSQLLQGGSTVVYRLSGSVDLKSTIPLLGEVNLPFDQSGEIRIVK